MSRVALTGAALFDGTRLLRGHALLMEGTQLAGLVPDTTIPNDWPVERLASGTLAPGLIDLQVNGGGGAMLDGSADVRTIRHICETHARLGTTGLLPTLISDTAEATRAVVAAAIEATRQEVPGFLGLHLEGPHLDPCRAGAHDPAMLRPMGAGDLALLCEAAQALPALMVTVAPSAVTETQITALAEAGALVSLGHAACSFAEAEAARRAGARGVTHLFNAMSGLGSREPGLVGAALGLDLQAGLIADGIHVHPLVMRLALAAKGVGSVYLVSDAMAVAGTDAAAFTLGGRRIARQDGRLVLPDGTLAGADLTLPRAIAVMVEAVGVAPETALAMATRIPAELIGSDAGCFRIGAQADLVHLGPDWRLEAVWRGGARLAS